MTASVFVLLLSAGVMLLAALLLAAAACVALALAAIGGWAFLSVLALAWPLACLAVVWLFVVSLGLALIDCGRGWPGA